MTDVDLDVTNATASDIKNEVINLIYVVFNTFRSYMDLIILLAIAAGLIAVTGGIIKAAKGLGK